MSLLFRLLLVVAVFLGASNGVRAGEAVTILALGDSLTAGYGLDKGFSFPARLQVALNKDGIKARIVNGGVSGDTSAGGLARLAWLLSDPSGEPVDAVILALGANDGLRGLDPAQTRANLNATLARLGKRNIPVLVAGMLAPPNLGNDYGVEFNAIYPELAEQHGQQLYAFFLDGVAAKPELNQHDGIHPNEAGVDEVVRRMLPSVNSLIARASQHQQGQ